MHLNKIPFESFSWCKLPDFFWNESTATLKWYGSSLLINAMIAKWHNLLKSVFFCEIKRPFNVINIILFSPFRVLLDHFSDIFDYKFTGSAES